jgi:regulator of sirC expression with transglutaminase-like and TPR domain
MKAKKRPTAKDVAVLLSFLSDGNERTAELAKEQLRTILQARPEYHKILENAPDPRVAHQARVFLEDVRLEELWRAFETLGRQGESLDLEHGAYLMAKLAYPALRIEEISHPLDQMAQDIDEIIDAEEPTSSQAVGLFRRFMFDEMGFSGNERNYYDPDNSFLNRVLERRMGIPISLSCVYLLVAWRLDWPVSGIGLPGHFIVGHGRRPGMIFVDPFHDGRILTRNDCIALVRHRGLTFKDSFLEATPNDQILSRMVVNLMNIYNEQGATLRAQWLGRVVQLLQEA